MERKNDGLFLLIANCLLILAGMLLVMTLIQSAVLPVEMTVSISVFIVILIGGLTYWMQSRKNKKDSDEEFLQFVEFFSKNPDAKIKIVVSKADDSASHIQCEIAYTDEMNQARHVYLPCNAVKKTQYDLEVKNFILNEVAPGEWNFVAPYIDRPDARLKLVRYGERGDGDNEIHIQEKDMVTLHEC